MQCLILLENKPNLTGVRIMLLPNRSILGGQAQWIIFTWIKSPYIWLKILW